MLKLALASIVIALSVAAQQQMEDLRALRLKLSAGDLPSAESVLEVHRASKGEDAEYLMGVAWLARGAAMLGDWPYAKKYADRAQSLAQAQIHTPADYESHKEATFALGTAIEVRAEALANTNKDEALRFLEQRMKEQAQGPFPLRARLWKRWNQIALKGLSAPAIATEDALETSPVREIHLGQSKPYVLFFWAEWCGDCKAQAAAFRQVVHRYGSRNIGFAAITRFYTTDHQSEKERASAIWSSLYGAPHNVPVLFSDQAMLRYGVSATPTFVFVDRNGAVTQYSPTRLTTERLEQEIDSLLR